MTSLGAHLLENLENVFSVVFEQQQTPHSITPRPYKPETPTMTKYGLCLPSLYRQMYEPFVL